MDYKFDVNDDIPVLLKLLLATMNYNIDLMDPHFMYTLNGRDFDTTQKYFLLVINNESNGDK